MTLMPDALGRLRRPTLLALAFAAGKLGLAGANLPARDTVLALAAAVRVEPLTASA